MRVLRHDDYAGARAFNPSWRRVSRDAGCAFDARAEAQRPPIQASITLKLFFICRKRTVARGCAQSLIGSDHQPAFNLSFATSSLTSNEKAPCASAKEANGATRKPPRFSYQSSHRRENLTLHYLTTRLKLREYFWPVSPEFAHKLSRIEPAVTSAVMLG